MNDQGVRLASMHQVAALLRMESKLSRQLNVCVKL